MNPKDSNVYNIRDVEEYTTPTWSHIFSSFVGYKHVIPSGLETEIINNFKGLWYE